MEKIAHFCLLLCVTSVSPAEAVRVEPTPEPSTLPVSPADQQNKVMLAAVTQFLQSAEGLDVSEVNLKHT